MKKLTMLVGLAGVIGFVACGGEESPNYLPDPTGGSGGKAPSVGGKMSAASGEGGEGNTGFTTSGSGGTRPKPTPDGGAGGAAGGEGGAGGVDPGTPPTVTILSPEPVTDPLGGKVLVADSVDVVCKAEQGTTEDSSPVDATSVKLAVLDADGAVISEKDALESATSGEFTAALPLGEVSSGKVILRCTAESETNALGTDTRDMLADRGPKITLTKPVLDEKQALKEPMKLAFTALAQPITPTGDTQADVASVQLKVNGVAFPALAVNGSPGSYEATVNLDGPGFNAKPNGPTAIAISASNKRAPTPAVANLTSSVIVDGAGPVINMTGPASGAIVAGPVHVTFSVTDFGSGVNPDSIVISIDDVIHEFDNGADWTRIGDSFTFEFDSRDFPLTKIQIPIKVTAKDNVGNASSSASIPIYLDNVGPQIDLDPQHVRTRADNGDCSITFDPLGSDAVNDLQQNGKGVEFVRALVWDKTNEPASIVPLHIAGVNPASVQLVFRNPSDPTDLLINSKTPGIGICNEIDFTEVQAESINLAAVTPTGTPYYAGEKLLDPNAGCTNYPSSPKPLNLCGAVSSLWQVVGHFEYDLSEPALYVFSPNPGASECTGRAWDYSSLVDQDGFVCFAARALDKVGNVGVSPPLRLCVDTPGDASTPACANSSIAPPKCTDGCTAPARGGGRVISLD